MRDYNCPYKGMTTMTLHSIVVIYLTSISALNYDYRQIQNHQLLRILRCF